MLGKVDAVDGSNGRDLYACRFVHVKSCTKEPSFLPKKHTNRREVGKDPKR
jgi:hypothetical protein